jgi:acetyl esterase/lipase
MPEIIGSGNAVRFDVVFASRDGRDLHVDIYDPNGPDHHRVAVLVFHPGGWANGDRKMVQPQCEALARRGFTALAVEYRLVPEAPWPAQLADVKSAIRWTLSHADELGIDPGKLVLQGHSAGAHLALIAAGTSSRGDLDPDFGREAPAGPIAAVVAYYPPVRLDPERPVPDMSAGLSTAVLAALRAADGSLPAGMLLADRTTTEAAATASPLNYAADLPPTVLFHGTSDSMVAPAASESLYRKMSAAGLVSELHLIAGVDHSFVFVPSLSEGCAAVAESFLSRYVIDPQAFAEEETRVNPIAAARRGAEA